MSVIALVEKLAPYIEKEVNLVIKSKEEAESLSFTLNKIQEGLQEAEKEGVTDKGVKGWLKQLESVTYEMDDLLDEWETETLQVEVEDTSLNLEKVCSFFFLCSCFKPVISRRDITLKMKELSDRIEIILQNRGNPGKYNFVSGETNSALEFKQPESTSSVEKKFTLYGLDKVKDSLIEKLVLEGKGSSTDDTQIISIVGLGGVGKSTLAQVAYNHPEVVKFFAPKGWVSLSRAYDALTIAKKILESFGGESAGALNLDTVVKRIEKVLDNKRFLLVLDNVWEEDRSKWEEIRKCLDGRKGSRIIITTRDESVERMMGIAQRQLLGLLSDIDCGEILNEIALYGKTGVQCEKLRAIGEKIAKKCNGLPLAAKSVGSMLESKSTEKEWMGVLDSPLWKDTDKPSDLFRLLNLSYVELSPVHKRCLLSSAVLPKGTSLSIDELNRVWMAHGYLKSKGSADEVRSVGFKYLEDLAKRSFFHKNVAIDDEYGDGETYKMHDIMHDFATYLSENDEYSFISDGGLAKGKSPYDGRFRTFSVCRKELPRDIVSHLTRVRVLSMRECNLQGVPEDIGKLIHLRYLNVSGNPITQLPETITDLCNLQTLDIASCLELSSLPEGIGKLTKLRHLVNSGTVSLLEYPQGLEKLRDLQTLSEFRGSKLGCLGNLDQLQGSLFLFLCYLDEGEIGEANLCKKEHIKTLRLSFGEAEKLDEVVEGLEPPPSLLSLEVLSESGKWLSRWITSFDNLKVVSFDGSWRCVDVPPFGKLPALEELEVRECSFRRLSIGFLGVDQYASSGGFPKLKKLCFSYCDEWIEWEDIWEGYAPVLTSLEELEFKICSSLQELPLTLLGKASSLHVVTVSDCQNLSQWYNKISGDDRYVIPLRPNLVWNVFG